MKSKFSPFTVKMVTTGFYLWSFANVMFNFGIYYNVQSNWLNEVAYGIQYISFMASVCTIIMWTRLWLKRQNGEWTLTLEEFTFLIFAIPTFLYSPDASIWGFIHGNTQYRDRNEGDLIFLIGSHLMFAMVLIGKK